MRTKLVVGNWKMNPTTVREAVELARAVAAVDPGPVEVGVAPPYVALTQVRPALGGGARTRVFAQDVHWESKGAYTGQVSAPMVLGLVDGAIVGHSEVRRDQRDDDARVAAKAGAALSHELRVIFCLGESLTERRQGQTDDVIRRQVRSGVGGIREGLVTPTALAIAYEPIWAIGTGEAASPEQATAAIAAIRRELDGIGIAGERIRVLYGGSVSASNAADFAAAEGVDGALVGGASLKAEEFAAIVRAFR